MFNDLTYAYIVGDGLLFIVWLILFLHRKDLRKEMLLISILSAPVGLTQYFFEKDYWQPLYIFNFGSFGIEDLLYMFFTGGIVAVIYEEFFGKKFFQMRKRKNPYFIMLFLSFAGIISLLVGMKVFQLNSVYVSSIFFGIAGLVTVFFRHDLFKHAFYSGLLLGVVTFIVESIFILIFPKIFKEWWLLENLSGILVNGIPIEEFIFSFTLGFMAGPMYEFVFGLKNKG